MKIGLYFGSFNPVHIGHLIIARHILNNHELDQIWMVISPQNPLKAQKSLLNEYHRKYLIDLALDGETKIKSSSIEFSLPRPSYTIDTLLYLEEKYPGYNFSVIMGSDSYMNLDNWKNSRLLLKNYDVLVYLRPGFPVPSLKSNRTVILDAPLLDISSTMIRKHINAHKSIRYLVPDKVMEEIVNNNYYKV